MRKKYSSRNNRRSGAGSYKGKKTSGRSYGSNRRKKSFSGKRNYKRGGNRGGRSQKIPHAQYVAKATHAEPVELYDKSRKYSEFDISESLKNNIARKNFVHPTIIQSQAIPHVIKGKDIIGRASTGSGKTAAFLIPLIDKIIKSTDERVLIVTPTRELAAQIEKEFMFLSKGTRAYAVLTIGGKSINRQAHMLRKFPNFVIGTPGRLIDLQKRKYINLRTFNNIVLDEVDRMLDMGFIDDIKKIIDHVGEDRQSLFFSATMSPAAERLARKLLKDPVMIEIAKQEAHANVDQDIIKVKSQARKIVALKELLSENDYEKTLIFARTRRGSDNLARILQREGYKAEALHGDKPQHTRTKILGRFRRNAIKILIATDVASRGIDVPDISHVINYDEPSTYDDYIHRIGRTGRIGKKGHALTFVIDKYL